jgi:hypothetical protein
MVTERLPTPPETVPPELRARVRRALEGVPGIDEVRASTTRSKLYVVLGTHDVERDFQIAERLVDLGRALDLILDYDLVPARALGRIADRSEPLT